MVGGAAGTARSQELRLMSIARVILVHLRQPNRADANEARSDPFFEHGSFGCTGCHVRNLMHPARADELDGTRFGFAQGGRLGFRLVHLTPPVRVVKHEHLVEVIWEPVDAPFRYSCAPVLVDAAGYSDFPGLVRMLDGVRRASWAARFSSKFRSRRAQLPSAVANEVARVFDSRHSQASRTALAATYIDTLPYPPPQPDADRAGKLAMLRGDPRDPRSASRCGWPTSGAACTAGRCSSQRVKRKESTGTSALDC